MRPGSGSAPLLVETSQMPAGRIWPVDSTLRLKCLAQGEPEPHLIWLKVLYTNFFDIYIYKHMTKVDCLRHFDWLPGFLTTLKNEGEEKGTCFNSLS